MKLSLVRRSFFRLTPLALPLFGGTVASGSDLPPVPATFPTQPPELVKEMVSVSHGNVKRVRELVEARPTLSKAAWDWGFGDWETALGAASHVGNQEIAEYLIEHGARPTLFSATMLGYLEVVKAFIAAEPGVQRIAGPHSISLLAHAKAGGAKSGPVLRYLESLGDADRPKSPVLIESDATALTGTYIFGRSENERIEVAFTKGQLTFTRTGTSPRNLLYVGDRDFHPSGAAAVRIRFRPDGETLTLAVYDPELVLTANRSKA